MKKQNLFVKLNDVVKSLNWLGDDSQLVDVSDFHYFRVSIDKPCLFLSSVALSYLTSVGVPFDLDIFDGHINFDFHYETK